MPKTKTFDRSKALKIGGLVVLVIVLAVAVYLIVRGASKSSSGAAPQPTPGPLRICTSNPANCIPANVSSQGYASTRDKNVEAKVPLDSIPALQAIVDKYPEVEMEFSDNFGNSELKAGNSIRGGTLGTPPSNEFYNELITVLVSSADLNNVNPDLDKRIYIFEEFDEGFSTNPGIYNFEVLINVQNIDTRAFTRPAFEGYPSRVILTSRPFENGCPSTDYCQGAFDPAQ